MKRLTSRVWLLAAILLPNSAAIAQQETSETEVPSLEFLEFLADFANEQNEWQDPMEMNDMLIHGTEIRESDTTPKASEKNS